MCDLYMWVLGSKEGYVFGILPSSQACLFVLLLQWASPPGMEAPIWRSQGFYVCRKMISVQLLEGREVPGVILE